jgi:hypothetical protein
VHEQQRRRVARPLVDVVQADITGVQVAGLKGEGSSEVSVQRRSWHPANAYS